MSTTTCPICYEETNSIYKLPCSYTSCTSCFYSWCESYLLSNPLLLTREIPCPDHSCGTPIQFDQLPGIMNTGDYGELDQLLLDSYLRRAPDVVTCPTEKCRYSGVVQRIVCGEKLVCENCQCVWRDQRQLSTGRQIIQFPFTYFGLLRRHMLGRKSKSCPKCNTIIYKVSGCSYMICSACKIHFCWNCLQITSGHSHKPGSWCNTNYLFKILLYACILLSILLKLMDYTLWLYLLFQMYINYLFLGLWFYLFLFYHCLYKIRVVKPLIKEVIQIVLFCLECLFLYFVYGYMLKAFLGAILLLAVVALVLATLIMYLTQGERDHKIISLVCSGIVFASVFVTYMLVRYLC